MSGRPFYSALGAFDSVAEISQSALIGSYALSHARPYLLNKLVAATSLAFLVAAAASRVNLRSGRTEEALQAIRLDRVYLLFVVGCTSSQPVTVPSLRCLLQPCLLARKHHLAAAESESSVTSPSTPSNLVSCEDITCIIACNRSG